MILGTQAEPISVNGTTDTTLGTQAEPTSINMASELTEEVHHLQDGESRLEQMNTSPPLCQ